MNLFLWFVFYHVLVFYMQITHLYVKKIPCILMRIDPAFPKLQFIIAVFNCIQSYNKTKFFSSRGSRNTRLDSWHV